MMMFGEQHLMRFGNKGAGADPTADANIDPAEDPLQVAPFSA